MNEVSLEKVIPEKGNSFSAVAYENTYFAAPLHVHPEYELILIEDGYGLTFVGDSVQKLKAGDFMLIGSNLPHLWLSADEYYVQGTALKSRSVYSQFGRNIFPEENIMIPELTNIMVLLQESKRGIIFRQECCAGAVKMFRELPEKNGFDRWLSLYQILNELAVNCKFEYLTSDNYHDHSDLFVENSITRKAIEYINKYYQNDITLESIAEHVGMNPSALCRYFKKNTGKKLFDFVCELRISYAAKLLLNSNISITRVAYDCGYNNLSHFNRQFKTITNYTPTEYRKILFKEGRR